MSRPAKKPAEKAKGKGPPGSKALPPPSAKKERKPTRKTTELDSNPQQSAKSGKRKPGQQLVLTKTLIKSIEDLLMVGNYFETACLANDISVSTAYRWLQLAREFNKTGEEPPGFHPLMLEMLEAVTRADAKAEVAAVATVRRHGIADPKTATDFLKRRWSSRWGDKPAMGGEAETSINQLLVGIASELKERAMRMQDEAEDADRE